MVNYPTLSGDKYYELAKKYLPKGGCGVVSFELKGGRNSAEKFMKNLKLAAIETHVAAAGIPSGLVRMSCGLEDKTDLIADLKQALEKI